jgi:hypothetical protein
MTTAVVLSRLWRAIASSTSACAAAVACSSDTLAVRSAAARIALRPFSHWHDSTCRARSAPRSAPASCVRAVRSRARKRRAAAEQAGESVRLSQQMSAEGRFA